MAFLVFGLTLMVTFGRGLIVCGSDGAGLVLRVPAEDRTGIVVALSGEYLAATCLTALPASLGKVACIFRAVLGRTTGSTADRRLLLWVTGVVVVCDRASFFWVACLVLRYFETESRLTYQARPTKRASTLSLRHSCPT